MNEFEVREDGIYRIRCCGEENVYFSEIIIPRKVFIKAFREWLFEEVKADEDSD